LKALSERLKVLGRSPADEELLNEAIDEAHRLAGSAGSYGFPAVSELAKRVETTLRRQRTTGSAERAQLERHADDADALAATVSAPPAIAATGGRQRRARLLVLDDDPEFLWVVRELGEQLLIDIICATTAQEAMERAQSQQLDGAILDVWLGSGEKSFKLARQLRKTRQNVDLPVAFTSADETPENRIAAANAGAALFLPKPLTETSLADAASQLIALRRANMGRVLVVDDDPDFAAHVGSLLEGVHLEVEILSQPEGVLKALDAADPEALLLDINMPALNGLDICRILRTNPRWQHLPIIIVTGSDRREDRINALRAGCDAYMVKPIDGEEFTALVKSSVDRRQLLMARLEKDALTGLPLRRAFMERLRSRLSEAFRKNQQIAICLFDLDGFKALNDEYGHLAGDRVLLIVGRLLSTRFRDEDLRARWGGEEFALAFPGETIEKIRRGVEQVLRELQAIEFVGDNGQPFHASFSAGLAEYPKDGTSIEALLRAADARLYEAKALGKGRVI
jgi:diguanylate cyclase (GGDEF)-like protein